MVIEDYVKLITKLKLSQRHFLFLVCVLFDKKDLLDLYKKTFPLENDENNIGYIIDKNEINDLIEKDYLAYDKGLLYVTEKFIKSYGYSSYLAQDLINVYPKFHREKDKNLILIGISEEKVAEIYPKKICNSLILHNEIKEDIEYGIKNNLLNLSLEKFLTVNYWTALRELREKSSKETVNVNDYLKNKNIE